MIGAQPKARLSKVRGGFSLLEVSVSAVLVGLLLVAALRSAGSAISGQLDNAQRSRASHLARDLLGEILQHHYLEPNGAPTFGPEAGETSRSTFDDVDDYHNLDEDPPADMAGTPLSGSDGWQRTVKVSWAERDQLSQDAISDTGVKRITVTMLYKQRTVAELSAVVTRARQRVPR